MKKRLIIFFVLACLIVLTTFDVSAGLIAKDETIRYKVTVAVETPEGDKIGVAVREATKYDEKSILPEQGGVIYRVTAGEATVVDLGKRGIFFALIGDDLEAGRVFRSFAKENKFVVDLKNYPLLVSFPNLQDPMSVLVIDPTLRVARPYGKGKYSLYPFEDIFGKGYKIKSVVFEKTNEKIQKKIDRYLPWLKRIGSKFINGKMTSLGVPYGLVGSQFSIDDQ